MKNKYVFITGGVLSSLGKGLAAASIGALLEARNLKITLLKMDPYLNVDPGTMNPFQHGEVFVTEDGAETDLDIGHYERFTNVNLGRDNSVSAGQIYEAVLLKERRGDYLGGTVQVIPHVTTEIKERIKKVSKDFYVTIVEIGGTVGDIESLPFLEAIRQFRFDVGSGNVVFIHVTLVPFLPTSGELKTKPTQHSVQKLREIGIQPDFLLCRTDRLLSQSIKSKISLFCNIGPENVFTAKDVATIYEVPKLYYEQGFDEKICKALQIKNRSKGVDKWVKIAKRVSSPTKGSVKIGIVGKYVGLTESYKSINEALCHGAIANDCKVNLSYIDSENLNSKNSLEQLDGISGILVPGGFGSRGIEGKIIAINFARENKIPFFGICIGMQLAVIEFARNKCDIGNATSREFSNRGEFVIDLMEDQWKLENKGASMRLGAYSCKLLHNSLAYHAYKQKVVFERHRHRYEFNNHYREVLEEKGLVFSGINEKLNLVEIIELPSHPWFLGCQFHPEFKSKPFSPHPLFIGFVKASLSRTLHS